MQKTFSAKQIEEKLYPLWEKAGYFKASGKGKPYCIVIPPPNVTGSLHMGHGFQYSLMDALIRYERMRGRNTHWQVGEDHAGIATQLIVEKQLLEQGIKRQDLGREEFLKRVWQWKELSKNRICQQMRRLGISVDWDKERFTLDAGLSAAVQKVFLELFSKGLIYRGKRLVNWDPVLHTAVSDLEVNFVEQQGKLWHIRYLLTDEEGYLIIATTRPETLLGDVAIAVHPNDKRYQKLIGKKVRLPLTDRIIPIIADSEVDPEFGTGCVKITPAHDFNDYAMGKRHKLELINIFTPNAHLNANAPEPYRGLERFVAREKIVADLKDADLLAKVEPHQNKIPKGDRSGAILEPYLTNQWFVKTKPLADKAIASLKEGQFKFVPESWSKTYLLWLENIEDWCISRQLWWGHRIPAWYDEEGNVYVGDNESEVRQKYQLPDSLKLTQDEDVLDTWFSSALWPFSSLGWPEKTADFKAFYPTNVLVTGFDIIFFWVARMVMFGLEFTDEAPFKDVYITGLIRDSKGQKMSKSKGNILDPLDLIDGITLEELVVKRTSNLMLASLAEEIEKTTRAEFPDGIPAFGTDALRFTFCALATTSRDINFDLNRLEGYRNFCNKLWNAARFVLMNVAPQEKQVAQPTDIQYSLADRWIRSKLQLLIKKVEQEFANYRFDLVAQAIYDFVWHEYCDWYLEFSKAVLNAENTDDALKIGTRQTLIEVLENLLRIIHPLMPFISEEIWQQVAPLVSINEPTSIMLQAYPNFKEQESDKDAVTQIEWLKQIILAIRNIRGEMQIAPSKFIPLLLRKGNALQHEHLTKIELYLKLLAKLDTITWLADDEKIPASAVAVLDELELLVPLAGLIDVGAEKNRLKKEIALLEKDKNTLEQKLKNENFVNKAPPEVVTNEKQRLANVKSTLEKLHKQLDSLKEING